MVRICVGILLAGLAGNLPAQVNGVRVYADPTGPYYYVDGQQYSTPSTQIWPPGSKHQLKVDGVGPRDKVHYVGLAWETNHGVSSYTGCPPIPMSADPDLTFVKCNVQVLYAVTLSFYNCPDGGACVSPGTVFINGVSYKQDAEVYIPAGSTVKIEAYPNDGWVFLGWGQLPGADSSTNTFVKTFTLNQPQGIRPVFQGAGNLQVTDAVNVTTVPAGLTLLMDRSPMVAPFTLNWGWNTDHTVGTLPAQRDGTGHTMIFSSWSDGGDINHTIKMPAQGSPPVNLSATFVPGATVTFLTDPVPLQLTVDGQQNWQNYTFAWAAGTKHSVAAAAQQVDAQGHIYKFVSWSNGGAASQQITVATAPDDVRYTATYAPVAQVTVNSAPPGLTLQVDGAPCTTPCAVQRGVGVPVGVSAPAIISPADGSRLVFQGWADGGSSDRKLTASTTPQNLTANYQAQYRLDLAADPPDGVSWRVQPDSVDRYYDAQTPVAISADTRPGFRFLGWSGDLGAASNRQASLMMTSPKSVVALLDRIPFVAPGAVRNAAGATPDNVVAPGSVVSITGVNLAPAQDSSPSTPLKQIIDGVTVWIGDELAPLFFVSPEQINAQLPSDLPEGNLTLVVRADGKPDARVDFTVARNAPGLFTQAIGGVSFVLAAHADSSPVTPDNPAVKGETLTLFGTGFGPYAGGAADGFALGESPNLVLIDPVSVAAGDSVLTPVYAGIAAGRVGVNAVRVAVADSLPDASNVPVKVLCGGRESNTAMLPLR